MESGISLLVLFSRFLISSLALVFFSPAHAHGGIAHLQQWSGPAGAQEAWVSGETVWRTHRETGPGWLQPDRSENRLKRFPS